MNRVYPSAVDTWLLVVMYASPVWLVGLGVYLATIARADEALTCFVTAIALTLLNLLLTYPCRYTLTADSLNIRCGLIRQSIPLTRIKSAEFSSSWLSAPALSLKRVRIQLDNGSRIVSPVDRQQFIDDLMNAVKQLP